MRSRALFVAAVTVATAVWMSPMQEHVSAQSGSGIVISEYRFRGTRGANDEFIELFNAGTTQVNIGGWMIRASNNLASPSLATRVTIPANTIIRPGCFYLITNANPTASYSGLVAGNLNYVTGFGDDGGLALTTTVTTTIVDQVGQGTSAAAYGEGRRLPMLTTDANRGIERRPGGVAGHVDTNDNFNDFREIFPANPQNASSACLTPGNISLTASAAPSSAEQGQPLTVFGRVVPGTVPPSSGVVVVGDLSAVGGSATTPFADNGVSPDLLANDQIHTAGLTVPLSNPLGPRSITLTASDAQGRTASSTISVTVNPPPVIYVPHEIQGAGAVSPFAIGSTVTVRGVVTARSFNGFYLQTEVGMEDADSNTSEGLFVFIDGFAPAAAQVGRVVNVTAAVAELVPTSDTGSPSITALSSVQAVFDLGSGPVPDAAELTSDAVSATGTLDQLERFEGMRVHAASLMAVTGTGGAKDEVNATSTSDGAFYAVLTGQARPFREPGVESGHAVLPCAIGPCNVPLFDGNPERLRVDTDALEGMAAVNVATGAVMDDVTGPLDFASRTYTILPEAALNPAGGMNLVVAPAASSSQFTVASINLERFFGASPGGPLTAAAFQTRLAKASLTIRDVLNLPDIIGVQEVQDLGVLTALAQRIDADAPAAGQSMPNYEAHLFEGNDPDDLDVGFLIKTAGSRVTALSVEQVGLDTFIDPSDTSQDLLHERPPVVLRALVSGPSTSLPQQVTVIVNHQRSLAGVDLNDGTGVRVREQRKAQAEFLANYLQGRQSNDPGEAIVSIGDYNAFSFNDGYVDTVGTIAGNPAPPDQVAVSSADVLSPDLVNASELGPAAERYSSVSNGNAQALDHVLVSASLTPQLAGVVRARVNADFPEVLRGDASTASRLSDRDPVVAYFSFPADVMPPVFVDPPSDQTVEAEGPDGAVVSVDTPSATDNLDMTVVVTCSPESGSLFPLGHTGVTCSARDAAGNLAETSFTVSVTDTTVPVLTVPSDIVEEANSSAGNAVSFATSATDTVTLAPSVACSPASGSTFALGTTTVQCSTQDAAGNASTGSFAVTVRDTIAPALTVPGDLTAEASSAAGALVTFEASATDAATSSPSVVCSPASGNVFALGATTVQCSTQDAAGNASTGSFTVTVRDTIAPAVTVPGNMTAEAASASGAAVTFAASATDVVTSSPSMACAPVSGSTFAIGTNTVQCSAQDAAGNSSSQSFTLTVRDTTRPVLTLPADISSEASSTAGQAITFTATASDAVTSTPTATCTPASGSTFQVGETVVTCAAADAAGNVATGSFRVTVTLATLPMVGRLTGGGAIGPARQPVSFAFDVRKTAHTESGRLWLRMRDTRGKKDWYQAEILYHTQFSGAGYLRGRKTRTRVVDTATFSGTGTWNGVAGYRFEATASDRGEPGRNHDRFAITVFAPNGAVVLSTSGVLVDGNIKAHY